MSVHVVENLLFIFIYVYNTIDLRWLACINWMYDLL